MSSVNPNLHQVPASNINLFENNQVPPSINNPYLNLQQVQNNIMGTNLMDLQNTSVLGDGSELLQNIEIVVMENEPIPEHCKVLGTFDLNYLNESKTVPKAEIPEIRISEENKLQSEIEMLEKDVPETKNQLSKNQ